MRSELESIQLLEGVTLCVVGSRNHLDWEGVYVSRRGGYLEF